MAAVFLSFLNFFLINLYILIGESLLYITVMVFAIHQHESATGIHVSPQILTPASHLLHHPIPLGCPRALALRGLLHALNLHRQSILHMVIFMFQCYSLKSCHPRLLPPRPKVCSLHLCLLYWLACRIISTIFLNSIYMC